LAVPAKSSRIIAALSFIAWCIAVAPAHAGESKEVQTLRHSAESGDAAAQLKLARAYDSGNAIKADIVAAAKWYEAAARQGNSEAQNALGSLYLNGEAVAKDAARACEWFAKSAAQGNASGVGNLGYCYDAGIGVDKDVAKAAELYQRAANEGDLQSMLNIGVDYWEGEGTAKDLAKAYTWLDLVRFYTQTGNANRMLKWRARNALGELSREISAEDRARGSLLSHDWDQVNRSKVQSSTKY
jgi:uncharacterized protein